MHGAQSQFDAGKEACIMPATRLKTVSVPFGVSVLPRSKLLVELEVYFFAFMAKTKEQKAAVIEKIEQALKVGASSVFVHFTKVTVAEESAMRRALKKDGVLYFVAKKTLIRRALRMLGLKHDELPLEGEVAIASLSAEASAEADGGPVDSTAPARLIHEFGKKLTDKLTILGGVFEGKLMGQAAMQEIATIPSMQALRGMFVNVINSPIAGLAVVLKAVADKRQ